MKTDLILKELSLIKDSISLNDSPIPLDEACKYLNVSKSYLYKLTYRNKIPHYKPNGKKIYFLKSDLKNWLLRNPVRADTELERDAINYVVNKK
ncbi:helix-turn-helix domain-containing protein [Bacteroidota bacterium]